MSQYAALGPLPPPYINPDDPDGDWLEGISPSDSEPEIASPKISLRQACEPYWRCRSLQVTFGLTLTQAHYAAGTPDGGGDYSGTVSITGGFLIRPANLQITDEGDPDFQPSADGDEGKLALCSAFRPKSSEAVANFHSRTFGGDTGEDYIESDSTGVFSITYFDAYWWQSPDDGDTIDDYQGRIAVTFETWVILSGSTYVRLVLSTSPGGSSDSATFGVNLSPQFSDHHYTLYIVHSIVNGVGSIDPPTGEDPFAYRDVTVSGSISISPAGDYWPYDGAYDASTGAATA